jgi:hypothetical protein
MAICLRNEQHEADASDKLARINRPDKDKRLRLIDPRAVTLCPLIAPTQRSLNDLNPISSDSNFSASLADVLFVTVVGWCCRRLFAVL